MRQTRRGLLQRDDRRSMLALDMARVRVPDSMPPWVSSCERTGRTWTRGPRGGGPSLLHGARWPRVTLPHGPGSARLYSASMMNCSTRLEEERRVARSRCRSSRVPMAQRTVSALRSPYEMPEVRKRRLAAAASQVSPSLHMQPTLAAMPHVRSGSGRAGRLGRTSPQGPPSSAPLFVPLRGRRWFAARVRRAGERQPKHDHERPG